MFPSQDNECARNAHFTARSENPVFLKIQYFKKETFVRVETFRIFYGPWNLYMGRISDRSYVIHGGEMLFIFGIFWDFWDLGIFLGLFWDLGILKIPKIRLFPLDLDAFSLVLRLGSAIVLYVVIKEDKLVYNFFIKSKRFLIQFNRQALFILFLVL